MEGGREANQLAYRGAYGSSEVNQRTRRWDGSMMEIKITLRIVEGSEHGDASEC